MPPLPRRPQLHPHDLAQPHADEIEPDLACPLFEFVNDDARRVLEVRKTNVALTAQLLGLGGATADSFNRLSVNTPAVLLNNAGAGIEATVNKAAAGNDAAFAFKTGFAARALIGLLGNDDFSFKVSPDGSAFYDAIHIDRASGQVELPQPTVLPGLSAAPTLPPAGKAAVYARSRAGAPWIDVMRPSGRDFPLQPYFGVNRIATWSPSVTTTITTEGMPITSVGTVSHPTLAATNLAASMRRWRLTSAAVVDSVADQRSAGWACWRGNAAGLGIRLFQPLPFIEVLPRAGDRAIAGAVAVRHDQEGVVMERMDRSGRSAADPHRPNR